MSDKKHIDRLFQEAFKDFEETPSDAVWEQIEAKLKQKKKRRVIPIWWRYSGVAALLLLLLTLGKGYFSSTPAVETPNQVVDTEEHTPVNSIENTEDVSRSNAASPFENNEAITDTKSSEEGTDTNEKKPDGKESLFNKNRPSAVASNSSNKENNIKSNGQPSEENMLQESQIASENPFQIANHTQDKATNTSEINQTTIDESKVREALNSKPKDAVANTDSGEKKNENQKTIEEALEEAKNIDEEEKEKLNRWRVAPNAAPVFFNTLGQGSSIDPQFNKNSKSSETNMSYGVIASYAINDKLRVRSGVNKVNLGYSTNDVVVLQSLNGRSSISFLSNVKPELSNSANDISVLSSQNFASKSSQAFATNSGINTSINQSFSFIEIPLEVEYALIDKKIGVNVIGGFSSLFLSDNELTSNFEGRETTIGEANNINDVSYSANFGLGLSYKFSKKINLNVEPMFKYQMNTFENTSGDFKPYFIGVYTGFGIKF